MAQPAGGRASARARARAQQRRPVPVSVRVTATLAIRATIMIAGIHCCQCPLVAGFQVNWKYRSGIQSLPWQQSS